MSVVADTSPVHYLLLIDQIALLPALFKRVFLPATVQAEMLDPKIRFDSPVDRNTTGVAARGSRSDFAITR